MIGRYGELCASKGGGVRVTCWKPDGGWEPKNAATRTCEARGEIYPTHYRAKGEAINYKQTEGEGELFHTDRRERGKTLYFMPKVG